MSRTKVVVPLMISFIIVVITGYLIILTYDKTDNNLQQKTSLRLRWMHQSQFAGIYCADEQGIFEDNHLDVEINPGGPGINFIQVVATGAEDFGIAGAAQIIEARDNGLPVVALAIIFQKNPNIYFAKRNSGIRSIKEWKDKKVAVYYGYDLELIYEAMVKQAGLERSDINEQPATGSMTPFFSDKVDVWGGYKINQPFIAEEKGYEIIRFDPDDYGIHVSGDVLFTTEKMIEDDPELVQNMVNSIIEGWEYALENQSEAVDIVLTIDSNLEREHELKMINAVKILTLPPNIHGKIGWMEPENWNDMVKLWDDLGGLKGTVDPSSCYKLTFIKSYYNTQ